MRVLFHTQQDGQSYHRVHQPAKFITDPLKERGIELVVAPGFNSINEYDAYIIQRLPHPDFMPIIEEIIKSGKKFIYSMDDDCWRIPESNPSFTIINQEAKDRMAWCVNNAHAIISSTIYLERVLQIVNGGPLNSFILPNLLDLDEWTEPLTPHDKLRILFAGSGCHSDDLNMIAPTLERIMKKHDVIVVFFGDAPDSLIYWKRTKGDFRADMYPKTKHESKMGIVRPVRIEDYPKTLRAISPDIGICPLTRHPFNSSKSNLKYLEYTLSGATTIATNSPPYQKIKGLLTSSSMSSWESHIEYLIKNPTERKKLQEDARKDVEDNFSWQNKKDLWINAFCAMLIR